jgi:hypothetical protein
MNITRSRATITAHNTTPDTTPTTTPNMTRSRATALSSSSRIGIGCAALLATATLLSACSSSGSSAGSGSTSSTPAGTSSTSSSPSATSSSKSSGGGSLSLGGGSFCSVAKDQQAQESKEEAAFEDTPAALKSYEQTAAKELPGFAALAPAAIKPEVEEVVQVDQKLLAALAKVNYNMAKMPQSTLSAFSTPALTAANQQIISYLASACGIKEPSLSTSPTA